MKKKVILIVVAVVLLLAILLGVLLSRDSGPKVVSRSYDAPIPQVMKNSGAELSVAGLYEFSLNSDYTVSYLDDDFLIFYACEPMELDGQRFSSYGYYLYTYETKEVQPIIAAGFGGGYHIHGNPGFVRDGDKIYFHLMQANQTYYLPGENRYYSFDCVTGELLLLETDNNDAYFREKVVHDGKIYSLNGDVSFFETFSRTYVQEFDPETGKLTKVLKANSVLPFSTGKMLLKIGLHEDSFRLISKDAKTGTHRVEFYDTDWNLLNTVSLANYDAVISERGVTFWNNFLLISSNNTLYCIDLSSDSLDCEVYEGLNCAQIAGDSPETLLLYPQSSTPVYSLSELYGLNADGSVTEYEFDPFGWGKFYCSNILQSGDHIMFLYGSTQAYRNIYTDLATLESSLKK